MIQRARVVVAQDDGRWRWCPGRSFESLPPEAGRQDKREGAWFLCVEVRGQRSASTGSARTDGAIGLGEPFGGCFDRLSTNGWGDQAGGTLRRMLRQAQHERMGGG